ncbi:uncharacterized protein (UPF0333 family) [Arcicella rosea]|uniref:hypothetical protein n=1 Tax=Arcicella rosea TaxID=502909 RepID=UPI00345DA1BA|eukprot:GDKJ01037313.1.p1 GENE.GDKJ01037313.1~~GDKJ01037313.1.p1  ORF type:complete len:161 (+),score=12.72 GDKJ01037313.1:149-631(+)
MIASLSQLGIFHTVISIIALIFAGIALFSEGLIKPFGKLGKYYSVLTAIACISSFWLSKTGKFNPGHAIGILILLLLILAYYLGDKVLAKSKALYIQTFSMSTTVFLSLIPAVNETLSRLPVDQPLSSGPDSPIVQNVVKVLLVLLIAGLAGQYFKLKKA